ncbi:histone H1, orphon-like [Microplitis mediator]|uniref:histone H1, orphon-like n=1 Tax=Microplitis mediator TaxID=375433 RepID=UPI002556B77F|nr:histone H1, orphon-like [Microplitis mediator]
MTETSSAQVEEKAPAKVDSPKKAAAKKPALKATHPSAAEMVTAAIKTLGERGGSSLQAIKKYIAVTYMVDVDKQAPFIKKFLKSAVTKGTLVQTKGKGASGSFKLAPTKAASKPKVAGEKKAAAKKPAAKKPAAKKASGETKTAKSPASPKKSPVKKPSSPKKPAAKSPTKAKTAASPKAKKATKAPTAKPKSPKPKKAAPKIAKSPAKKAAAKN